MKKQYLFLLITGAFFCFAPNTNFLSAQEMTELTVPFYSYGEVLTYHGAVTSEGVANPGPYGGYSTGEDERTSGIFLAHGYRWWGYPNNVLLICGDNLPRFNYPGFHGVWDMSNLGCSGSGNFMDSYMGSWGSIISDPDEQQIWALVGAKHNKGPTAQWCIPNPFGSGQLCYNIPSAWGYGSSYGYLRKVVVVQSTGLLQNGDPVKINASLSSTGTWEGDGKISMTGVLFLNKFSEAPWYQWEMGREYLRWGDVEDILGTPEFMNNMLGNLDDSGDTTTTVAIGDTIMVEVAFKNSIELDNPGAVGEAEGWNGERPANLFGNLNYVRTDSIKNLVKKYGNHLSFDLKSLTNGAILEPLTPEGPNLDTDGDGVTDTQEKGPDGNNSNFDGNSDGFADYEQDTVASLHTYDGQGYFTMVIPDGTELLSFKATDNPSPTDAPQDTDFPFGFIDFSIDGIDPGESISVKLILHNEASVNNYYKYGLTPDSTAAHWYEFMYDGQTGAEINQNTIILHFVDGLRGDEDITENGYIKEPGGIAAQVPEIHIDPGSIDFSIRAVGDTSDDEKVIIKNTGSAILQINDISIVWADSINFTITDNTCSSLNPMDTCSVNVVFNPQSLGDKEALLWIESNDFAHPTETVVLKGKGLAPKVWDYGSLAFGNVSVGDSAASIYTIKNKGNTNLEIQMVAIQEDDASDFYYTGLPVTPFNIGKNDSIMFNLVFKPGSLGNKTSKLRIFTNDLDLTRILTGTGTAPTFSVEGEVVTGDDTPVNAGIMDLLRQMDDGFHYQVYQKQYAGSNHFNFSSIPGGYITLRCIPDTNDYPGYLPTYLGNVTHWSSADFFTLGMDTSGLKITLVPVPPAPDGTSNVSGILVEESGKSGSTLSYEKYNGNGTPVKNISVFISAKDGDIVDYDITDSTGIFSFNNIPTGHYGFQADYVGFFMYDSNDSLIIDQGNQKYYISAVAANDTISIEISDLTGINNLNTGEFIRIFPNPARDELMVQIPGSNNQDKLELSIFDLNGKVLKWFPLTQFADVSVSRLKINDLPSGIYIISIVGNHSNFKTRFIKY